uniref:Uncharacterized protein n=1 Tax=Rhizophora mucronata TaxID=61149 RepID=A0A2P2QQS8_RHIMU
MGLCVDSPVALLAGSIGCMLHN